MRKLTLAVFFALILSILIFQPFAAQAGLVECEVEYTESGAATKVCDFCEAVGLISRIIRFLLFDILTPLTIIAFLFAGGYYLFGGENPGNIKKAHGIFRVAISGILIAFTGWIMVNTIINQFVNKDSEFDLWLPWYEIPPCGVEGTAVMPVALPRPTTPPTETQTVPRETVTANRGRALLQIGRVTVNRTNECRTSTETGCTSIGGLREEAITNSINIKANCDCDVQLNAGAESGGHSENTNHKPGNATVDYQYNDKMAEYIWNHKEELDITAICTRPQDSKYRLNCVYNETTAHLHVQYGTNN